MGTVYILRSQVNLRYYIGSTNDLARRLVEHELVKTKSLKFIRPFKLVFSQQYEDLQTARRVELKLKKLKSRQIIERIITDQRIILGP